MLKRATQRHVESLIRGWLLNLRREPRTTHLDWRYWGAYYWNERDYQWSLLTHLKKYAWREGFGSNWSVHAEGSWERPQGTHHKTWGFRRRSDIAIVDHDAFLKWWKAGRETDRDFPMEAAIELKLTWSAGRDTRRTVLQDIKKLDGIVRDNQAKVGYLVWLDSVREKGPLRGEAFFSAKVIHQMLKGRRVRVFHWPDGAWPGAMEADDATTRATIRRTRIRRYPS